MSMKLLVAGATAAMALGAVSAHAATIPFGDLEPETQAAACQALASAGGSETIYVVTEPPASEIEGKMVGTLLTDVFTGEVAFDATRVTSGDC